MLHITYILYYKISIGLLKENEKNYSPKNLKNENHGIKDNKKYSQTDVKSCHPGSYPLDAVTLTTAPIPFLFPFTLIP